MKCIILLFVLGIAGNCWTFPLHASCSVHWTFDIRHINCHGVAAKIMNQITTWTGPEGCSSGGEKCLYEFLSFNDNVIKATHTTPKHHYIDDLTFTISTTGSTCHVLGHSTSQLWYATLDHATNYCNLRNLITGSGLDKMDGFSESTSDSHCTQYSTANCNKY